MDSNGNLVTPIAIGLIAGSRQIPELHFEWDLKMTRKSDRNPNQETPLEFAKDEWVKFKPITRKVDLTPIERADFETAIYKSFDRLVSSWIRRFIPFNLLESNDAAQLHLEALNELIVTIWKILAVQDINANEATLICWTITNRRAIDSLRKEASLKRSIPGGLVELDAIGELADRNDSYSPDRVAELNDLKRVIVGSLQQIQQRVLELKQLEWTNERIAKEIGVSLSTLNALRKKIAETTQRIIENAERPAIIHLCSPLSGARQQTTDNRQQTTDNLEQLILTISKTFPFSSFRTNALCDLYR